MSWIRAVGCISSYDWRDRIENGGGAIILGVSKVDIMVFLDTVIIISLPVPTLPTISLQRM